MNATRSIVVCLLAGLCSAFFSGLVGCAKKEAGDAKLPAFAAQDTPSRVQKTPDYSLSAADFGEEFAKDKNAAALKYKGKLIELNGVIDRLAVNLSEDPSVVFKGAKDDEGGNIRCFTTDRQPWRNLVPGQKVKIQGEIADNPPFLIRCVVVESGPMTATRVDAEELAKECEQNREQAEKKFGKKPLIISGEIVGMAVEKSFNVDKASYLELKGDAKRKLWCHFYLKASQLEPLKVGQRVEIQAEFFDTYEDSLRLRDCFVMRVLK